MDATKIETNNIDETKIDESIDQQDCGGCGIPCGGCGGKVNPCCLLNAKNKAKRKAKKAQNCDCCCSCK